MAVNLNAAKSIETNSMVGLELTDVPKNKIDQPNEYILWVRKGILEVDPPFPTESQFEIITDSLTWKQLVLYKLRPDAAVANGLVVIVGASPENFYAFMDLFN
jgi:hypothetical protein